MEKIMPEDTVKYYPVLSRILMRLSPGSIVCYRATIVTSKSRLKVDHDLLHRVVTEYKGETHACTLSNPEAMQLYRDKALKHLDRKCRKRELPIGARYEPITEIVIDLRNVELSTVG